MSWVTSPGNGKATGLYNNARSPVPESMVRKFVALVARRGTSTMKYLICPPAIVLVTSTPFVLYTEATFVVAGTNVSGMAGGLVLEKMNCNRQLSKSGAGLINAPRRLSHTSSVQVPSADSSSSVSSVSSGR